MVLLKPKTRRAKILTAIALLVVVLFALDFLTGAIGKINFPSLIPTSKTSDSSLFGLKVDDWDFTQKVSTAYSYSTPTEYIWTTAKNIGFKGLGVIIALTTLNVLFWYSVYYLYYRFLGALVRIFKKDLYFGSRHELGVAFKTIAVILLLHVILAVSAFLLGSRLRAILMDSGVDLMNIMNIIIPIYISYAITIALLLLIIPASLLAMIFYIAKWIKIKLVKKELYPMKRRLFRVFVLFTFAFFLAYLPIQFVRRLVPQLLGGSQIDPGGSITGSVSSPTSTGFGPSFSSLGSKPSINLGGSVADSFRSENIGFSTGGAKDINNFRENITNGYFPTPTDITYEGLFYDYFFDTGQKQPCFELFCPSYSLAYSKDPVSDKGEYYMAVGLNSGIKEEDFARKKLNLVIVMDISGSMSSAFNKYYYDQLGKRQTKPDFDEKDSSKTKMQIANESVVALLDHLNEDDSYGMVLFESRAFLAKPLRRLETTDMDSIKEHILEIHPQGGTNMESGLNMATEMLAEYKDANKDEYENRIIFLTDAQPNTGRLGRSDLTTITEKNAGNNIYTTFIGVGLDFNTDLVESLTKVKGANYYSVHSSVDFKERMDEGFEYMVTPLVFDLKLTLESSDFEIEKVFGSPEANESTGELMKVNTLFPSKTEGGQTKGGIVLLKLKKKTPEDAPIAGAVKLTASYYNRTNQFFTNDTVITIPAYQENYHENTGILKAIMLARYVNIIHDWIIENRVEPSKEIVIEHPLVNEEYGISIPPETILLSKWERRSVPLEVSAEYGEYFSRFRGYFVNTMQFANDNTLSREIVILDKLVNTATAKTTQPESSPVDTSASDARIQSNINKIALAVTGFASAYGRTPNDIEILGALQFANDSGALSPNNCIGGNNDKLCNLVISGSSLPNNCGSNRWSGNGTSGCTYHYFGDVGGSTPEHFRISVKAHGTHNSVYVYDSIEGKLFSCNADIVTDVTCSSTLCPELTDINGACQ